jgi:hypothetical protein
MVIAEDLKVSPFTTLTKQLAKRGYTKGSDCDLFPYPKFGFTTYFAESDPYYLSYKKVMRIKAPLERVEKVIDDIDKYKEFLKNFDKTEKVPIDKNKWNVNWIHIMPTIFVPNIVYTTVYFLDKPNPNMKVYRYQLKEANHIKHIDGLITLEKINDNEVCFTGYEFNEGEWGLLKAFVSLDGVWKGGMKGNYVSDHLMRLRIENPDWTNEKLVKEGEKIADAFNEEAFLKTRKKLKTLEGVITSIKN